MTATQGNGATRTSAYSTVHCTPWAATACMSPWSCGHIVKDDNSQRSLPLCFKSAPTAEILHKATPAQLTFTLSGILPKKYRYKLWDTAWKNKIPLDSKVEADFPLFLLLQRTTPPDFSHILFSGSGWHLHHSAGTCSQRSASDLYSSMEDTHGSHRHITIFTTVRLTKWPH